MELQSNRNPDSFKSFAEKYRLRVRRDSCGDPIIPGKRYASDMPNRPEYSSHVYDPGDTIHLGIMLLFNTARKAGSAQRQMEAAGFLIRQVGHSEISALFDPDNLAHARVALKLAGIKKRRVPSPAQLEAITKARQMVAA